MRTAGGRRGPAPSLASLGMRTMRMLAAAVVLGGCTTAAASPPTADPPPALHACAAATTECSGTVEVPLNWDDPGSERISVTFLRIPRQDQSQPAAGTILAHLGGPAPSLPGKDSLVENLGPVLERQDLLLADLRGMGRSSPISCTGVDVADPATIADCGRQLGPRGAFFSTDQAVRDYDAVRAALGVPRVTFFGNSYGTTLAQAYVTRFPDHLSAVYLNGVVPSQPDGYGFTGGTYYTIEVNTAALQQACEAGPECSRLPGTSAERLAEVVADLRAQGRSPEVVRLESTLENASFEPRVGRDLNAALHAHLQGDPGPLRRLTDAAPPPRDRGVLRPEQAAALLTYGCGDAHLPYDRAASPEERGRELAAFYEREQPFHPFTPAEGRAGSYLVNTAEMCQHWPLLRDSAPVAVGASHPAVPVLETRGTGDPSDALDPGSVARRFPHHTHIQIPYGTHQSWDDDHPVAGWCVRTMMREFLLDPRTPAVDHGCDWTTYRPLGAFPRTAAELPPAGSGELAPAEATTVAAAFAVAADATIPLHPTDPVPPTEYTQPGVRGGTVTLDAATGTVALDDVRFVDDVTVEGAVTVDAAGAATAVLTTTGPAGAVHRVTLTWALLAAPAATTVTGMFDDRPFEASVPAF